MVADAIGQVHGGFRATCGYWRVQAALSIERDLLANHRLVVGVMRDLGLSGLPRRKAWKRNLIGVRTSADLAKRNFTTNNPDHLWVTDITEHPTKEGTVYACVVRDVFLAKLFVGQPTGGLKQRRGDQALHMAWSTCETHYGSIIHADHGAQFPSWASTSNFDK